MSSDEREHLAALDELARAYRRLPRAEPSPELDAAILARARTALGPRRSGTRWSAGLATAAVLAMAVGLSWQLRQREQFELPPEPAAVPSAPTTAGQAPAASAPAAPAGPASGSVAAPAEPDAGALAERVRADDESAELAKEAQAKALAQPPAAIPEPIAPPARAAPPLDAPMLQAAPAPPPPPRPEAITSDEAEPFPDAPAETVTVTGSRLRRGDAATGATAPGAGEGAGRDVARKQDLDGRAAASTRAEETSVEAAGQREDLGTAARERAGAEPRQAAAELEADGDRAPLGGAAADAQKSRADDRDAERVAEEPAPLAAPTTVAPAPATTTGALGIGERKREARALAIDDWLARIRELRRAGAIDRARDELREFRSAHPDTPIPADLRDLLEP